MTRRNRAVLAVITLSAIGIWATSVASASETSELKARETLKVRTLEKARRQGRVTLRVAGNDFALFGDGEVRGVIVPAKRGWDAWRPDEDGLRSLEERIAEWLSTSEAVGHSDPAEVFNVEITDLEIRGKDAGAGRMRLVAQARLIASPEEGAPLEGVYRFRAHTVRATARDLVGVLEEGWVPGPAGPIHTAYRIVDDRAIVGGDMIFSLAELRELQDQIASGAVTPFDGESELTTQAAIAKRGWPDGIIPYEIADGFSDDQAKAIAEAIEHWNSRTLVSLVPRDGEETFVRFAPTTRPNCYSNVGYPDRPGVRMIDLNAGCQRGSIIHEIGHTVGLWHEQSRVDRDTFVFFDEDAVDPDNAFNFDTKGARFGPYNYRSIMHYGRYAFALPGAGPVLTPLRDLPRAQTIMGQRSELSKGDIAAANYMVTHDVRLYLNTYSEVWAEGFAPDAYQYGIGDVSGDGIADLVAFGGAERAVFVARASASSKSFYLGSPRLTGFCGPALHCLVGDVDGDGRADVVEGETGRVAFAVGETFEPGGALPGGMGAFDRFFLTDVNGDCRSDLVAVVGGGNLPAEVYVALSTGTGFAAKAWWGDFEAVGYAVGDVDGDGRADFVARRGFELFVHLSHGDGFGAAEAWWAGNWFPAGPSFELADMNGDRRADVVAQSPLSPEYAGRVMVALSTGRAFRGDVVNYHELDCLNTAGCLIADVDDDGLADLVDPVSTLRGQHNALRRAGEVYVSRSTAFITDPIGPLKTVLADAVLGNLCRRPNLDAQL